MKACPYGEGRDCEVNSTGTGTGRQKVNTPERPPPQGVHDAEKNYHKIEVKHVIDSRE